MVNRDRQAHRFPRVAGGAAEAYSSWDLYIETGRFWARPKGDGSGGDRSLLHAQVQELPIAIGAEWKDAARVSSAVSPPGLLVAVCESSSRRDRAAEAGSIPGCEARQQVADGVASAPFPGRLQDALGPGQRRSSLIEVLEDGLDLVADLTLDSSLGS